MYLELVQIPSACTDVLRPQSFIKLEQRLFAEPLHRHQLCSQLLRLQHPLNWLPISEYLERFSSISLSTCCNAAGVSAGHERGIGN